LLVAKRPNLVLLREVFARSSLPEAMTAQLPAEPRVTPTRSVAQYREAV